VGGLEEKVAVAKHHGIKTLICPLINRENGTRIICLAHAPLIEPV
jgi:ATP-dependent Lon protease